MKIRYVIPAVAVLIVMTGCSTGPDPQTGAAQTSTTPSLSAVGAYELERDRTYKRELAANAAVGLPHDVDRGLAEAAAKDGVPLGFTHDGCGYIRLPDRSLWSLSTVGGALSRDSELEDLLSRYGGWLPGTDCTMRGVNASIPVGFDGAAADSAAKEGKPYRWTDGCRMLVRVPGSTAAYWLPDKLTASGTALGTEVDRNGCGGPKGYGGN